MSGGLRDIIEEASLLVAMLHEKDEPGFQLVFEQLEQLERAAAQDPAMEPLRRACRKLLQDAAAAERGRLRAELVAFTTAAQQFMQNPQSGVFADAPDGGGSADGGGWEGDLSPQADHELIPEFIAQHTLALDEFEAELLRLVHPGAGGGQSSLGNVRAYLHSLKGDAATVGLAGMAEAAHFFEDLLAQLDSNRAGELLLQLREWLIDCMQAYSAGRAPSECSAAFIRHMREECGMQAAPQPAKKAADAAGPAAEGTYRISQEFEVLAEFLAEAEDHLNAVEEALLQTKGQCDGECIASFFRAIHSVKGGSSYFDLREVTETSHRTETLLDKARSGEMPFNEDLAELVLQYTDLQKELFKRARRGIENQGVVEACPRVPDFLAAVEQVQMAAAMGKAPSEAPAAPAEHAPRAEAAAEAACAPPAAEERPERARRKPGEAPGSGAAGEAAKAGAKIFLKVEAGRLDQLIDNIGEMVISSSMVLRDCRMLLNENDTVMKNAHRFEQIVREVQYIAMTMRLVPIKGIFQKMSRLVWDLSKRTGKVVRFEMEGEDTELDRTVIEQIADPLMHMVRNAVDHGIESPEERRKAGKPAEGMVRMKAFHQDGNVHIQVQDDGRGLDPDRILRKAVGLGLAAEDQKLSREEVFGLIFASGFSTAERVSDISGRGVGMDVVRRNIESLRGRVSIESELGAGTTFTVRLPLTLAIIEGIETLVGCEHFIIPTLSIVEFIKPAPGQVQRCAERGEALQFRGRFLPIFHLWRLYRIADALRRTEEGVVVVVQAGGEHVGLAVDRILGSQSTVIKSLGGLFADARGVAGGAIMPDGSVGLILDIPSLINFSRSADAAGVYAAAEPAEVVAVR